MPSLTSKIQSWFSLETKAQLRRPTRRCFSCSVRSMSRPAFASPRARPCNVRLSIVRCSRLPRRSGSCPFTYKRGTDGAKDRAPDHPAYDLLKNAANDWTPASQFREELTRDALLYPNGGFAFINRNGDGKPVELLRLDPEISPVTVKYENGEPTYSVREGKNAVRAIPRENMLHIPSPSLNGRGLVYEGREAIGLAITLERHAARLFGNGARPSGVLSLKGTMTPDALLKAKTAWQASQTGENGNGTAVIPADASWTALTLNSVDSQFIELRTYAVNEIARLFRVPPHLLFEMSRAAFRNTEQMGQEFLSLSLMSWIKRWEGEIRLKLFQPEERAGFYAEFLTDDFARADLAARMEAMGKAIAARILNPNEARAMNNLPPYAGGEVFANPNTTSSVQSS